MSDRILPPGNDSLRLALAGDQLARLHAIVSGHLEEIAALYKPEAGMKLTLVARAPGYPDGSRDCVVTNDELADVVAALELRGRA